jgi:hypothetical protein
MRARAGEIKFLVDAMEARRLLWIFCLRCGHSTREHPYKIARGKIGGLAKLEEAAKHCKCRRCSSRAAMIVPSLESYESR